MNDLEFDLLIHNWIPCTSTNGTEAPCSIRSALEGAVRLRAIEHESPVVCLSALRLLIAFCYRVADATGMPLSSFRNWKKVRNAWRSGIPAIDIDRYLDERQCRGKFRLFDKQYPFFQVADLRCQGNGQPEAATRLLFDQFAGTPTSLWEHMPQLPSVEEAALYLVCCQAFGASASNTSKANVGALEYSPTGRTFAPSYTGCTVWLEGRNLLETLLLNLVDYDMTETDVPIWEDPLSVYALIARQPNKAKLGDVDKQGKQIKIGKKIGDYKAAVPTGPVQLFTWPSRAVLLGMPDDGKVRTMHYTQGIAMADLPVDPMKPYKRDGKPLRLQRHKAAWRDLHSILELQPSHNRTVVALSHAARCGISTTRLNVAGVARGDEVAKILFWRRERLPVPAAILDDINLVERSGRLLQMAEVAESELYRRAKTMARLVRIPDGREPSKNEWDDIEKVVKAIDPRPAYWARLEKHFFSLLEDLPQDWDATTDDWKPDDQQKATRHWGDALKREARRALEESIGCLGTSARAISAVARVRTDFCDNDLKPRPPEGKSGKRKSKRPK